MGIITSGPECRRFAKPRSALNKQYPGTKKRNPRTPLCRASGQPLTKKRRAAMLKLMLIASEIPLATLNAMGGWKSDAYQYARSSQKV